MFGGPLSKTVLVVAILGGWYLRRPGEELVTTSLPNGGDFDPCCAYPCQNNGICLSFEDRSYACDCTRTGYFGANCTLPYMRTKIVKAIRPKPEWIHNALTTPHLVWNIVNAIPFLSDLAMKYIYITRGDMIDSPVVFESDHHYSTLDAYFNETYYGRTLPPIAPDCPLPMGILGPKTLPTIPSLIERVFNRRSFIPEPLGSNALFQYYAQHFTHQFFRTDYKKGGAFTKGSGGVDASNIYGLTEENRQLLRLGQGGKLKFQMINGEEFPPYLKDVPGLTVDIPKAYPVDRDSLFALGHPFFVLLPGLFMYATLWLREHNRVCEVLAGIHPHWDDERLYHTARLVVTGEIIKITIEDYVQHLSNYRVAIRYKPEVIYDTHFQFDNRISLEFNHLYHWHPLVPDKIKVENTTYGFMDMAFSVKAVFNHGLDNFIHALSKTRAGKLGPHNHPIYSHPTLIKMLEIARVQRIQPFNNYRHRFGMAKYSSFEELTGDAELASVLREMYGHVDAVEFYVGLLCERPSPSVNSISMVNMGGPWSVKGLIANPVSSPQYHKPSTFGGPVGFDIVRTASFTKLLCNNMRNKEGCDTIGFKVPDDTPWE